jgi:hypothetical protein
MASPQYAMAIRIARLCFAKGGRGVGVFEIVE